MGLSEPYYAFISSIKKIFGALPLLQPVCNCTKAMVPYTVSVSRIEGVNLSYLQIVNPTFEHITTFTINMKYHIPLN